MKKVLLVMCLILLLSPVVQAKDVYVHGYSRSDGTYVQPYIRSSPDTSRENNYGPSQSEGENLNPRIRDNDGDGIPNYKDKDDDNDGVPDNKDKTQYGGDD